MGSEGAEDGLAGDLDPLSVAPVRTGVPSDRPTVLFRGLFVAIPLAIFALLLYPILRIFQVHELIGADWSEYLYSGPAYLSGSPHLLLIYPFPVLPIAYLPLSLGLSSNLVLQAELAIGVSPALVAMLAVAGYFVCRALTGARWAGLLGMVAIGSAPLLDSELAWGGQAQILAFALGLLALWVVLEWVLPLLSVTHGLIAGLLLVLGVFTESYATAYFVATIALLIVATLARRLFTVRGIVAACSVILPAVSAGAYVFLTDPATANPTGEPVLGSYWRFGHLYNLLWINLTGGNAVLGAAYAGVGAVYVGYRLVLRSPSSVQRWLVPASLLSAGLLGGLVTPGVNAYRALYPLAFPFAFVVAEMAAVWPGPAAAIPSRRNRLRLRREEISWALPLLVVVSLAGTGIQVGADTVSYPNSLRFYSYSDGYVTQLAFLRDQSGAVLYDASPVDHAFVTLWATGKPIYPGPPFQPFTVTSGPKQAAVRTATELSYGTVWVTDGPYTVTDAEPYWAQPAPGVLFLENGQLVMTLESSDFLDSVSYAPAAKPTANGTSSLYFSNSFDRIDDAFGFTGQFGFPGFTVSRTIDVQSNGAMYWNYSYVFTTAIPHNASVYLTSPNKVPSSGMVISTCGTCSNASLSLQYTLNPVPPIFANYSVSAVSSNARLETTYLPSDKYGIFSLEYFLVPTNASIRTFSLSLQLIPYGTGMVSPEVENETMALNSTGIRWVVLTPGLSQIILQRFMDDPGYSLYRTTPAYYVLRVG